MDGSVHAECRGKDGRDGGVLEAHLTTPLYQFFHISFGMLEERNLVAVILILPGRRGGVLARLFFLCIVFRWSAHI